jgi:hypothetical protein
MTTGTLAEMTADDFPWAAQMMQRRRERYAQYSPVFWRPAHGIVELHAGFLGLCSRREGAVALRTRHGFIVSCAQQGRCFVDDFAVDDDSLWPSEGKLLLLTAWRRARSADQSTLRVVTARRDGAKRNMLIDLGLTVASRWWVKELAPTAPAQPLGPITLADIAAVLVAAPPVYDPGGPVCLLGALDSSKAALAAERAAAAGAVLAIVQCEGSDAPVPEADPLLEAAGYHNPAEFYQGAP